MDLFKENVPWVHIVQVRTAIIVSEDDFIALPYKLE